MDFLSNSELSRLIFAIMVLLSAAHLFGYIFQRLRMPRVVGEICGGLVLGPTVLAAIAPSVYGWLFNAFALESKYLSVFYWFGLIFLMFISGCEVPAAVDRKERRLVGFLLAGSTLLPFLAGFWLVGLIDPAQIIGSAGNLLALQLVVGISVAVTSIPVISKIFIDLDLIHTAFAKIVLATSTMHDLILWVVLAIATGLTAGSAAAPVKIVLAVSATLFMFLIGLFIAPRLVEITSQFRLNLLYKSSVTGYALLICFLFSALASLLDVNIVFGAFLAGIVSTRLPSEVFTRVKEQIKGISLAFFIPLYFALVGIRIDLLHGFNWLLCVLFLVFAIVAQMIGSLLSARLAGKDNLSSLNLAFAMNARGGPGIILASVALEAGIVNQNMSVILILTAIITSLMAGWWFWYVQAKGWALLQ